MSYKRILVPVDGSPTAAKGLKEAIRLARESSGKLLLLHVVEQYTTFMAPEVGGNFGQILDAMRAAGKRALSRAARSAAASGAKPQEVLAENFGGRVADIIVQQAKKLRADLIVMGTHGRRGLSRALLGSDAESVVRYSPVPVLLIPAAGRGKGRRR